MAKRTSTTSKSSVLEIITPPTPPHTLLYTPTSLNPLWIGMFFSLWSLARWGHPISLYPLPYVPQEGIGITFLQWLPTCQPPPSYGALESGIQGHLLKVTAPQLGSSAKLSVRTNDNFFFFWINTNNIYSYIQDKCMYSYMYCTYMKLNKQWDIIWILPTLTDNGLGLVEAFPFAQVILFSFLGMPVDNSTLAPNLQCP